MCSLRSLSLVLALPLLTGCPSKSEGDRKEAAASASTSASAASVASAAVPVGAAGPRVSADPEPATTVKGLNDPGFAALPLFTKLAVEKQNRPPGALKAEVVFDAITGKMGAMKNRSQLAGFTVVASYCEKADTELGVDVVVCEYPDAASLAKGKGLALKNDVKRREILTVKSSYVSITRFSEAKEAADQAKQIAELVKTL
jgi:hypothetical protein